MIELNICTTGRPDLLNHQIRLIKKNLKDEFELKVTDNTPGLTRNMIEAICNREGIHYAHIDQTDHNDSLNYAASHVTHEYFGFLDHDIFPIKPCTLIDKIDRAGFYGLPQTHRHTRARYLWPGFCFFTKEWLGVKELDFNGIRGRYKEYDGDCGSMLCYLFTGEDWNNLMPIEHNFRRLRDTTDENIQSWGYEIIGGWLHFTNASHWLQVEQPKQRDLMLLDMLNCL